MASRVLTPFAHNYTPLGLLEAQVKIRLYVLGMYSLDQLQHQEYYHPSTRCIRLLLPRISTLGKFQLLPYPQDSLGMKKQEVQFLLLLLLVVRHIHM